MNSLRLLLRFIRRQFTLHREEDEMSTYAEILEGVQFKGYNLWILAVAMIVASIGLDVDSPTAIIGAMLMSPLMGPAIGFAYGMATHDTMLTKICVKNWLLMTATSLAAASLFFFLSPFDRDTASLASYKEATIFDISIAFFGGMAGFLGIVKKEGIKIIAGVAVATACMPPLCTAAFGLAHGKIDFIAGGLYYYLINTLFIGLATYLLARYLKYHTHQNSTQSKRRVQFFWQIIIVVMMVPGVWVAYKKWNEQHQVVASTVSPDKERINVLEKRLGQMDSMLVDLQLQLKQSNGKLNTGP